jgi:pimeloyl-ACP methyl ester carboxylesterase
MAAVAGLTDVERTSRARSPSASTCTVLPTTERRHLHPCVATLVAMTETTRRPHVVIIGGFLTEALQFRPMRQRLLDAGAARVTIAPIHLPDWAVMGLVGFGPLLLRGGRAIREARQAAPDPVMVVGHSLGGLIARLATCETPLDGRAARVAADVGCVVTLGTPHAFEPRVRWRHAAVRAAEHLSRACPDGYFAPATGYLTVGSSFVRPGRRAARRTPLHWLNRVLRDLVGETEGVGGDGLVDARRCRLAGVRHVELDDTLHGTVYGPWYGDTVAIERWWPAAVEEWQRALAARDSRH